MGMLRADPTPTVTGIGATLWMALLFLPALIQLQEDGGVLGSQP